MTEFLPYVQFVGFLVVLGGFALTISTIVFYGGKLVERQTNTERRVENHEDALFGEHGLVRMVDNHEYHIQNMCDRTRRGM